VPNSRYPGVQVIRNPEDLDHITFHDDMAAVEVPFELLDRIDFAGEVRQHGPRLARLVRRIRREGYRPVEPIICRIGMKGRWVVVDGGHRITAARKVGREWWSNLCGRKVTRLYFLLFTTAGSWSKVRETARAAASAAPSPASALPTVPPPEVLDDPD